MRPSTVTPGRNDLRGVLLECGVIVVAAIVVFVVSGTQDILENLVTFCHQHEHLELDEWIVVAVFLSLALTVFALRRWREVRQVSRRLAVQNADLQAAAAEIRRLQGLIPICARCKSIRDDAGIWREIEAYMQDHSDATFTHGICPTCARELFPDVADDVDLGESEPPPRPDPH